MYPVVIVMEPQKKYGFFKFLLDVFMVFLTYGLWLIWIFVREMRNRSSSNYVKGC